MQPGYARTSLLLFGISVALLIALTAFERALVGTSQFSQWVITLLVLVVPAVIGVVSGVLSLTHKEGRTALAIAGILLNALFALFHLLLLTFAG